MSIRLVAKVEGYLDLYACINGTSSKSDDESTDNGLLTSNLLPRLSQLFTLEDVQAGGI